MNIKPTDLLRRSQHILSHHYDEMEALALSKLLLLELFGIDRAKLMINDDFQLTDQKNQAFDHALSRMVKNEPIQHIIGKTYFYGMDFHVNQDVLIPRPETEELVDLIINNHQNHQDLKVIDIGTGSGCIPIALAKALHPSCSITGLDISQLALNVALKNAKLNHQEVDFIQLDILNSEPQGSFDIIVSNPPYITVSEKSLMHPNVLDFEPEQALFVPDLNPLLFYKRIALLGTKLLNSGGHLYFEINEHYGAMTKKMIESMDYVHVNVIQDLNGKDRILYAQMSKKT